MTEYAVHPHRSSEAEIAENIRLNAAQKARDERAKESVTQNKPVSSVSVELTKIRRELLTLASRIDILISKGQETA